MWRRPLIAINVSQRRALSQKKDDHVLEPQQESEADKEKRIANERKYSAVVGDYHFDSNVGQLNLFVDTANKKVPVFSRFTVPTNSTSFYDIYQAVKPLEEPFYKRVTYSHYGALSQDHRDANYAIRGINNLDTHVYQFPEITDFMIIGSGFVGSAMAYYLKKAVTRLADVCVIDKDPYTTHSVTSQCNGLLSFQSKIQDHVRMSTLSKELIRNLIHDPIVTPEDIENLNIRPVTHLILWPSSEVHDVLEATDMQISDGCHVDIKVPPEVEKMYPWLKVTNSDVVLATHGNQDEYIVDPIKLRNLYRTMAQAYGANFIQAEAIDFNMIYNMDHIGTDPMSASSIVVKLPTGELKHCYFSHAILSMGHQTPYFEQRAVMDRTLRDVTSNLHFLQPRFRVNFLFRSPNCPSVNFPVITDTDGSVLMKDDSFDGTFKYCLTIKDSEKIMLKDSSLFFELDHQEACPSLFHKSDSFRSFFDTELKPKIVNRIPAMEDAEFVLACSGFQSFNAYDSSPLISMHPYFSGIVMSGGYGSRLMNYGPAAAISLAELLLGGREEHFDVTNYYWERVIKDRKIKEFASLVA